MKNKNIILFIKKFVANFIIILLSSQILIGQTKVKGRILNEDVYICSFLSIGDTMDASKNFVFMGVIKNDIFFEQFIDTSQYANPNFVSDSMAKLICEKIAINILVEIPELQFYLGPWDDLDVPFLNVDTEKDLIEADSTISNIFNLPILFDFDLQHINGGAIKVRKAKVDIILLENEKKTNFLFPYAGFKDNLGKTNTYHIPILLNYFNKTDNFGIITKCIIK